MVRVILRFTLTKSHSTISPTAFSTILETEVDVPQFPPSGMIELRPGFATNGTFWSVPRNSFVATGGFVSSVDAEIHRLRLALMTAGCKEVKE
jgi:hypothetical protein